MCTPSHLRQICWVALMIGIISVGSAQLPVGTWQSLLPHKSAQLVTQSPDKIIYSTGLDLIVIDKEELSAEFISTVDGLSEQDITAIQYDYTNEQLIIGYRSGNVDIIKGGNYINIPNIKNNRAIANDRRITKIYATADGAIFLGTAFGIVELSGDSYQFGATVNMGIAVADIITNDGQLYASTDEGLYVTDLGSNLSDFSQWKYLSDGQHGLPSLLILGGLVSWDGGLYVAADGDLYRSDDGSLFEKWLTLPIDGSCQVLRDSPQGLLAGYRENQEDQSTVYLIQSDGSYEQQAGGCNNVITDALMDSDGRIWYGDEYRDIRYAMGINQNCQRINYDSPYHQSVSDIAVKDNQILVASGGVSDNFQYLYSREGIYLKEGANWTNYNENNNSWIRQADLLNFYKVAFHPTEPKIYGASYWNGLAEINTETGEAEVYGMSNSTLQGTIGDDQRVRVTGLAFDEGQNLWVSTFGAPDALHVRTADGQWARHSVVSPTFLSDITIDEQGYLWSPVYSTTRGGVLVYNPGDDPISSSDDQQIYLTRSNSAMTTNIVRTATVDRDGLVWVGTDQGPVVFDPFGDLFDPREVPGLRIKVVEDGIPAFLLADQDIRAIAVDGGNRKWFGTANGIFVQSPDGKEKVHRFTTDNSPLFDNLITDLAYDGATGLMYIGTGGGLMAYQTVTTTPENKLRKSAVLASPNPVQPDYEGVIAITGLIADAIVKITDVNGRLINEIKAQGGTAIWDRTAYDGSSISSGVYLVFSSNGNTSQSPDGLVSKIMILR